MMTVEKESRVLCVTLTFVGRSVTLLKGRPFLEFNKEKQKQRP